MHTPQINAVGGICLSGPTGRLVPAAAETCVTPSREVVGHWELVELIRAGETAEVFAARPVGHSSPNADYVVKRLRNCQASDPVSMAMFRLEVACGLKVSHRNLLPILAANFETMPYFHVTPRIEGASLREVLDSCRVIAPPQALWIARQLADACSALHAAGWIHSDIKPSNVIGHMNGHATLIDYGFAVRNHDAGVGQYQRPVCTLKSTMSYTAPELFTSNQSACAASDVYSLGVVLFELLTGQLPFPHKNAARLAEAHLLAPAPSPRSFVSCLPKCVSQLVTRMMAKDPSRRPSTSGELQYELRMMEVETFAMRA